MFAAIKWRNKFHCVHTGAKRAALRKNYLETFVWNPSRMSATGSTTIQQNTSKPQKSKKISRDLSPKEERMQFGRETLFTEVESCYLGKKGTPGVYLEESGKLADSVPRSCKNLKTLQ